MTTNDKPVKINASFHEAMRFFARLPDVKRTSPESESDAPKNAKTKKHSK